MTQGPPSPSPPPLEDIIAEPAEEPDVHVWRVLPMDFGTNQLWECERCHRTELLPSDERPEPEIRPLCRWP